MLKLDFSHMAAWTSMCIYSHPWLLRFRFLLANRLLSSLGFLCLCFFLLPCKRGEGDGVVYGSVVNTVFFVVFLPRIVPAADDGDDGDDDDDDDDEDDDNDVDAPGYETTMLSW